MYARLTVLYRIMVASRFLGRKRKSQSAQASSSITELPVHVSIIMDGNNRWTKLHASRGISGHRAGAETIRKVLNVCQQRDIRFLTLFAFSSENWSRPDDEVAELMQLLRRYLSKEVDELHQKGIRIRFAGRRDRLAADIVELMEKAEQLTEQNPHSTLTLAIDYGGRWDIVQAARELAMQVANGSLQADSIDEDTLGGCLSLAGLPPPDLCIRTGSEQRISNFLLWDLAYAELYFTDCLWPDFNETQFEKALLAYSGRQRRFGKTSEQIESGQ